MSEAIGPVSKQRSRAVVREVKPPEHLRTGKADRAFVVGGGMSKEDAQMLSDALAAGPNEVVPKRKPEPKKKPGV